MGGIRIVAVILIVAGVLGVRAAVRGRGKQAAEFVGDVERDVGWKEARDDHGGRVVALFNIAVNVCL